MIVSIGCIQAIIAANPYDSEPDDSPEQPEAALIEPEASADEGMPGAM